MSYDTAIIFRRQDCCTLFEVFELEFVYCGATRVYPELAIEIPNEVFHDGQFQFKLANFLHRINSRDSDSHAKWYKDNATRVPRYTKGLLTGILRTVGRPVEVTHIAKHVVPPAPGRMRNPWRRSRFWVLIKVAIRSSLDRSPLGRAAYKPFMLFFMSNLANHAANASLSSDLLYLMSTKILRRFRKLGPSVPEWLSDSVMQTCTRLSDTLDNRCMQAQIVQRTSPLWNPSQLDLTRDSQLSLPHCSEYLSSSLTNHGTNPLDTHVFHPPLRGTLRDFLSLEGMFFEEAYRQNPRVALYDVEQVVKQEIDDWFACVTDVDEACIQLEVLVEKYMLGVKDVPGISVDQPHKPPYDPQHLSMALLAIIELWIALDKLVVKKIPILVGYSPEIPMDPFDRLLLKTMNLHRFFQAHQYLSARHAQSCPGLSVFSKEFTEHSFPVRCYDSSPHLQHLGCRIEEDLLPTRPLHVKVVLFELQCPVSFEAWRSVTIRLLDFFHGWNLFRDASHCLPKSMPITKIPEL